MLDVTDIEDVKTGDEVVVFGTGENGEPTADSLAEIQDTKLPERLPCRKACSENLH
mgnify:CR=1 FL=1